MMKKCCIFAYINYEDLKLNQNRNPFEVNKNKNNFICVLGDI